MKDFLFNIMCMVLLVPLQLHAQISTSIAQKYSLWTVVKTIDCNYMGPISSGSSQTWDYSGLTPITPNDTHRVQYIDATAGMLYPNASIVKKDGMEYTFYDYQNDGVYILGAEDSTNNPPDTLMLDNPMRIMLHPATYLNKFVDTFKGNTGRPDSISGTIIDTVESFGKLMLPNDTFENVIRMMFTITSETSIGGTATTIEEYSYLWFDNMHHAPLLIVDSTVYTTTSGSSTEKNTSYLAEEDPTTIASIQATRLPLSAGFIGNKLYISGGTERGHSYRLTLFDATGRQVIRTGFTDNGQLINTKKDIPPGMYILTVRDVNQPATFGITKLVK